MVATERRHSWDRTRDGRLDLALCTECDKGLAEEDGFCSDLCRRFVVERAPVKGLGVPQPGVGHGGWTRVGTMQERLLAAIAASPRVFRVKDVVRGIGMSSANSAKALRELGLQGKLRHVSHGVWEKV